MKDEVNNDNPAIALLLFSSLSWSGVVGYSKAVPRISLTLPAVDGGEDGCTCIRQVVTADFVVANGAEVGVGGASIMSMRQDEGVDVASCVVVITASVNFARG
jgi:hypothetical protein